MNERAVKKSVILDAAPGEVWKLITDPDCIRKFLFNSQVKTNWKKGSPIQFRGSWKGREYRATGTILQVKENELLEYSYFNNVSGLKEINEDNHSRVIYKLSERKGRTILSIVQANLPSQDEENEAALYWESVIERIVQLLEKPQSVLS